MIASHGPRPRRTLDVEFGEGLVEPEASEIEGIDLALLIERLLGQLRFRVGCLFTALSSFPRGGKFHRARLLTGRRP
jgi:hypothetical protein